MKNEFIPYEQALELKELGFDEDCLAYYLKDNKTLKLAEGYYIVTRNFRDNKMEYELNNSNFLFGKNKPINLYNLSTSPLYQQAFRWFREKYRLYGKPEYFLNDWYCFIINDMKEEDNSRRLFTEFPSYEEAELECLRKLIEIVKNK